MCCFVVWDLNWSRDKARHCVFLTASQTHSHGHTTRGKLITVFLFTISCKKIGIFFFWKKNNNIGTTNESFTMHKLHQQFHTLEEIVKMTTTQYNTFIVSLYYLCSDDLPKLMIADKSPIMHNFMEMHHIHRGHIIWCWQPKDWLFTKTYLLYIISRF